MHGGEPPAQDRPGIDSVLAVRGLPTKDHRAGGGHDPSSRARLLLGAAVCAVAATGIALPFPATSQTIPSTEAGQDSTTRQFNIPAQALSSALAQFGRQADLQIAFAYETPSGMSSSSVSGTMSPQQALGQLLAGTGATWRIAQGTVVIELTREASDPGMVDFEVGPDTVLLGTIIISGGANGAFTSDTPYETAGSVSHISRETLDRVSPTSTGDVFINTPGVISAGNKVGASIQPNIRGMQGMGRVRVTVDDAEQTFNSYRGYTGNRDESYVDPDMIGGIDITKGPGASLSSGIGGTVAFRTLLPDDILTNGATSGFRIRTSLGGNTSLPPVTGSIGGADRPSVLSGDSWSGSLAYATTSERFDFVGAFSKRRQGNYFSGSNSHPDLRFPGEPNANATVRPGSEVFNTSEEVTSALLKGRFKWGDGQSLELGFGHYDSRYGEINENLYGPWWPHTQLPLSSTTVNTYTLKYRWVPADNDLVDLRFSLWHASMKFEDGTPPNPLRSVLVGDPSTGSKFWGASILNTARFDTALGAIRLDAGAEFKREDAFSSQWQLISPTGAFLRWDTDGPTGIRDTFSAYTNVSAEVSEKLTFNAGLRFDSYRSHGIGYLAAFPARSESHISPSLGVVFTPVEGVQLFAQIKDGYRAPSLRETHWNRIETLINNPDLRGETVRNKEFGFNIFRDGVVSSGDSLRFKAVYFDNRYSDYIVRAPANGPGTGQPYQFTNIDGAKYQGFELSGSYDTGSWFVEGSVTKYRNVEYCGAGFSCMVPGSPTASALGHDYNANYIPPKYSGSVTAGARFFDRKLVLGARAHFAGPSFGSSWKDVRHRSGQVGLNFTWPSYAVYDVFGSYEFAENTLLSLSVENVGDRYYFGGLTSAGIASPGRTARIVLTHKF